MGEFSERWLIRLRRALAGLNWVFVTVGVVSMFARDQVDFLGSTVIVLALLFAVAMQSVPLPWLRRRYTREVFVVLATTTIGAAAALSGGFASPFVLLTITPIVLAAMVGGYRFGVVTGLLSVSMTALAEVAGGDPDWSLIAVWAGFALIVGITFGLARKLMLEIVQQADVIAEMSAQTGAELERLQGAHSLLARFEDMTAAEELDPRTVGGTLLASVRQAIPFSTGSIRDRDGREIATLGAGSGTHETALPIAHRDQTLAHLVLTTNQALNQRQKDLIADLAQPAGLALANIEAVQRIARRAIAEERTRVARELHDGIGPGLASLGLALDVAQMQAGDLDGLASHLNTMRASVTDLVSDVRATVEGLRVDSGLSLADQLRALETPNTAIVDLIEHREQPPPRLAADIHAVIIEAVRNAVRHAGASEVRLTGNIGRTGGSVTVTDNGTGFDPSADFPGHFGLIGMHERATRISGVLHIESGPDGTRIKLVWPVTT